MRAFTHVGAQEDALISRRMKEGKAVSEIAGLLRRDVSTAVRQTQRLSAGRRKTRRVGRPRAVSPADGAKIERTAERMIQKADAEWWVTASMVKRALKLKCCDRVILDAISSPWHLLPSNAAEAIADGRRRPRPRGVR